MRSIRNRRLRKRRRLQIERMEDRVVLDASNFVSVAMFFNLTREADDFASNYSATTEQNVRDWLREGDSPTTSEFARNYWKALSYNKFQFGIDASRHASGSILIPTVDPPEGDDGNPDPDDWDGIAEILVKSNADSIWKASGSWTSSGKRVIPSVVLVQNYSVHASAKLQWDYDFSTGGRDYRVNDLFHIDYSTKLNDRGLPETWSTMMHEYAHNFLEGGDLYGGSGGRIAYWDLLGDASPPGKMSDTSSYFKTRLGWTNYSAVVEGPTLAKRTFRLTPYATTGQAIKVVPDPIDNADEYFLLENRSPTNSASWFPDGNLTESGLLITHVNESAWSASTGSEVARIAPFMDVEEADSNDGKCSQKNNSRAFCDTPWASSLRDPPANTVGQAKYALNNWPGSIRPDGVLFPSGQNNSFTPTSTPNSNFYGDRESGLHITNIRKLGNEVVFDIEMTGNSRAVYPLRAGDRFFPADISGDGKDELLILSDILVVADVEQNQLLAGWNSSTVYGGWDFHANDQAVVGDFNGDGRDDLVLHNGNRLALFRSDGQKLLPTWNFQGKLNSWAIGTNDKLFAGDFDGDGSDDLFIRSAAWAGMLTSRGDEFVNSWITNPRIGSWALGAGDTHLVGDFNADNKDEIFIRSATWAGLVEWKTDRFENTWIINNRIGSWALGAQDQHFVGDFNGDAKDDVFIRSPRWAGFLTSNGTALTNTWITGNPASDLNRIDNWQLNPTDRHAVGDFNADGIDDIYIRSPDSAAILKSDGSKLRVEWMSGDPAKGKNKIGKWQLSADDREIVGDFNRDNRSDVMNYRLGTAIGTMMAVADDAGTIHPELAWLSQNQLKIKNEIVRAEQLFVGNFSGDARSETLAFDGNRIAIYRNTNGKQQPVWTSGEWIGGWHLGPLDQLHIGDFNNDGRDDVFIRSDSWAGLLTSNGSQLTNVWMTGNPTNNQDWIGGWHLGTLDEHHVGDFTGDGRDDVFIRSGHWASLLRSTGNGFVNEWMTGNPANNLDRVGNWKLGVQDRHYVGDFNEDGRDDIFIRSPQWAGLLISTGSGFSNVWITGNPANNQNVIGGWRLGPRDRHYPGDFNGDGKTDIFIRSDRWAALLTSNGTSLSNVWMTGSPSHNLDRIGEWKLGAKDQHDIADLNRDGKDDVFIRNAQSAAVLLSDGSMLRSVEVVNDRVGNWILSEQDSTQMGHFCNSDRDEIFVSHPGGWTGVFSTHTEGGKLNQTHADFDHLTVTPSSGITDVWCEFPTVRNQVYDVSFDIASPQSLDHDQRVNLTFKYDTNEIAGVQIFARPMAGGSLSPNYAAHGSPVYSAPTGGGSGFFTITTGNVHVDQIRIQMWDNEQDDKLFEAFVPVNYTFRSIVDPDDINGDGAVTVQDLDLICQNGGDLKAFLLRQRTGPGDANLDHEFNSSDFVQVFIAGLYETGRRAKSSQGDWNCDGVFDSGDFVTAFIAGWYEKGPRNAVAVRLDADAANRFEAELPDDRQASNVDRLRKRNLELAALELHVIENEERYKRGRGQSCSARRAKPCADPIYLVEHE